jgi:hypothetical protein
MARGRGGLAIATLDLMGRGFCRFYVEEIRSLGSGWSWLLRLEKGSRPTLAVALPAVLPTSA